MTMCMGLGCGVSTVHVLVCKGIFNCASWDFPGMREADGYVVVGLIRQADPHNWSHISHDCDVFCFISCNFNSGSMSSHEKFIHCSFKEAKWSSNSFQR